MTFFLENIVCKQFIDQLNFCSLLFVSEFLDSPTESTNIIGNISDFIKVCDYTNVTNETSNDIFQIEQYSMSLGINRLFIDKEVPDQHFF